MHDGMQYDPIQGQGHEPLKVENPVIFNNYLLDRQSRIVSIAYMWAAQMAANCLDVFHVGW